MFVRRSKGANQRDKAAISGQSVSRLVAQNSFIVIRVGGMMIARAHLQKIVRES